MATNDEGGPGETTTAAPGTRPHARPAAPNGPAGARTPAAPPRVLPALRLLREAHDAARALGRGEWDFAVELADLRRAGLTGSDCRWLVGSGLAAHGRETTGANDVFRSFARGRSLSLPGGTCFVLTARGILAARPAGTPPAEPPPAEGSPAPPASPEMRPAWDRHRQQLRVGGRVVIALKVPAAHQEMILAAFEDEGWPPRIDDPLPEGPAAGGGRLRVAVDALNGRQKARLLHFAVDGGGVRWEHGPWGGTSE